MQTPLQQFIIAKVPENRLNFLHNHSWKVNPLRATATIHRRQKPLRKVPRRRSIVADLLCEKCQATIRRRRLLSPQQLLDEQHIEELAVNLRKLQVFLTKWPRCQ
ncbi:hypothetical protein J6590_030349 [Homalodisca vitripennis]|nr:hypothetical protein J6590_030349 [Homalodisca vitripennis]